MVKVLEEWERSRIGAPELSHAGLNREDKWSCKDVGTR
jgi:hypothetical protein